MTLNPSDALAVCATAAADNIGDLLYRGERWNGANSPVVSFKIEGAQLPGVSWFGISNGDKQ